jgi:hypothetical protein
MARKDKVGIGGKITTCGITGEIVDEIQPDPFVGSDKYPVAATVYASRIRVSVY